MIKEQPLVSIIIPTYNRKRLISRAINSCIQQTYNNIEIIVCDDHSTDGTNEYIKELSKSDSRIIYCKTSLEHKGANAARNVGIQKAKGKYLCFLDSDDELLGNAIADRVEILKKYPKVGLVYGNAYCKFHNEYMPWVYDEISQNAKEAKQYLLEELSLCIQSSIMVRRKIFSKIGLLDEGQKGWTDDGLVVAVGMRYPMVHCGTFVVVIHKTRISMTSNKGNLHQGLKCLVKRYKKDIIQRVSFKRYFLWKIRILAAWCYQRETESKNLFIKQIFKQCHEELRKILIPYFRHYFE